LELRNRKEGERSPTSIIGIGLGDESAGIIKGSRCGHQNIRKLIYLSDQR